MHVRFISPSPFSGGGLTLATTRLAIAMIESGHTCDIASRNVDDDAASPVFVKELDALPLDLEPLANPIELSRQLAVGSPDVMVVASGRADVMEAALRVAPTLMHSHMHWATCPDSTRLWMNTGRECMVRAGTKCIALRPLLGCTDKRGMFSLAPVRNQQSLLSLFQEDGNRIGVLAISSHQAQLLKEHGVSERSVTVIPNLGMRFRAEELNEAAKKVDRNDRSRVVFIGRLAKEKGASLLPALAHSMSPGSLRVYGEGYLSPSLRRAGLESALGGHVSQLQLAGILQWARAVVLPSLWPEPGGIVGIDSQIFGTPLGAFAVGAAVDWPHACLFSARDQGELAAWASSQPEVIVPRSAEVIATRQSTYWQNVAARAGRMIGAFVSNGAFPYLEPDAVRSDLLALKYPMPNVESE